MKKGIVLIILTLFVGIAFGSPNAKATTKTQNDALSWVKSQVGKGIDWDGVYGCQCVDLIKAYYNYLGGGNTYGNGADYVSNALPAGWNRYQGAQPQAGDILVYSGGYGHVAIYESDRSHYHQNFNGHSYVEKVTYMYNGLSNPYWGVIRPNWNTAPSTPSYTSIDQKAKQTGRTITDGQYRIVTCLDENRCLDVSGGSSADGANLQINSDFTSNNSIFQISYLGDGYYKIKNVNTNSMIDVTGGSSKIRTNIQMYHDDGTRAQKWIISKVGNDTYSFLSACSNGTTLCMDVYGAGTANGTNVWSFESNCSPAQIWKIKTINPATPIPIITPTPNKTETPVPTTTPITTIEPIQTSAPVQTVSPTKAPVTTVTPTLTPFSTTTPTPKAVSIPVPTVTPISTPSSSPIATPYFPETITGPSYIWSYSKKRSLKVEWVKYYDIDGYEIQYALNRSFTKSCKTIYINNPSTTNKNISGLSYKKKYYVRIRAYKRRQIYDGINYKSSLIYSNWSHKDANKPKK